MDDEFASHFGLSDNHRYSVIFNNKALESSTTLFYTGSAQEKYDYNRKVQRLKDFGKGAVKFIIIASSKDKLWEFVKGFWEVILMGSFTFKVLLSLPILLLLWESLVNIYYWYFDFSFILQVSLLLLWSVTVLWVLKTRQMPAPVVISAFVVMYLSLVVDTINPGFRTYLDNALWAGVYLYLLREYHLKFRECC